MESNSEAEILRIFVCSSDKFKHATLYEMIVFAAKRYGMAGATVLKGVMGFSADKIIQSVKIWEITEKIPVVIEIIDNAEMIQMFVRKISPWLDKLPNGCIVTVEKVNVILYKKGMKKGLFDL